MGRFVLRLLRLVVILLMVNAIVDGKISMQLKALCDAGKSFLSVYNQDCTSKTTVSPSQPATPNTTAAPEDHVVEFCLAHVRRFENADDIPESEQVQALRSRLLIDQEEICSKGPDHVQTLIRVLHKATEYFGTLKNLKYNNAVVAIRTIQAQIALTLERLRDANGDINLTPSLLGQIKALESECKNTALLLEDHNSESWNIADRITLATMFWKSPEGQNGWKDWSILGSREISPSPQFRNLTHYYRNHHVNDACHVRMSRDCHLSQECANILIDRSATITTLLHNLAFFQKAIQLECVNEVSFIDKFPNGDWKSVTEDHCSKMWDEANAISNAGYPVGYTGLFLDHASMCALVGYPNILRMDWATDIIRMIDASANGCIPVDSKPEPKDLTLGFDSVAENGEWCTIFETSLGMQLLSLHLRYILETCPSETKG